MAAIAVPSSASAADARIQTVGSPRSVTIENNQGYRVDPDSGVAFDIVGPAPVLMQIWSTSPAARVAVTLTLDDQKISQNIVRFRRVPSNRRDGLEYVTLVSFRALANKHRYRVKVSMTAVSPGVTGASNSGVAVVPSVTRTLLRPFQIAPWVDLQPEDHAPSAESKPQGPMDNEPKVIPEPPHLESPAQPESEMPVAQRSPAEEEFGTPSMQGEGWDEAPAGSAANDISLVASKKLEAADDVLDVGGLVLLRGRYYHYQDGNPKIDSISSPNLTDIYFDATPNDTLRAYVRARLKFDPTLTGNQAAQLLVNQLWGKAVIAHTLFVTLGQQAIKWGTGRFHNPTDFLNRQQRSPFTLFDERLGIPMLKLHLPIESLGWNFYAIGTYDTASTVNRLGGALRAEIVFGLTELSLTAVGRYNSRPKFGFDFSSSLAFIDIFGELAIQQGGTTPFYRGPYDPLNNITPQTYTQSNTWLPQVAGGFETSIPYNDEDRVRIGAEYFYNAQGYLNGQEYGYQLAQNTFRQYYEGRHYAGVFMQLPSPGPLADWTFLLNTVGNLNDKSWLSWIDTRVLIMNLLTISFLVDVHWGRSGGEYKIGIDTAGPDKGVTALQYTSTPFLDFQLSFLMNI